MSIIKPGIACRTKTKLEHLAFEAACVAAGYGEDSAPYDKRYKVSSLSLRNEKVTQGAIGNSDYQLLDLEAVLFENAPDWAIDVRHCEGDFYWTDGSNRVQGIKNGPFWYRTNNAGEKDNIVLSRSVDDVEPEVSKESTLKVGDKCKLEGDIYDNDYFSRMTRSEQTILHFFTNRNGYKIAVVENETGGCLAVESSYLAPVKTDREKFIDAIDEICSKYTEIDDLFLAEAIYDSGKFELKK